MVNKTSKWVWYFIWVIAGTIILYWKLGDIVGLHRDEAIFGLFAEMILDGARPLYGIFNNYTSPVHAYMLAFCIKIFGNSIWSLRCLGPAFSLMTIIIIYDIVRQFSPIRARWTACFLVTFPPVVMFSRLCGEVFVLNPFLFFGTIWIYVRLCQSLKPYRCITGWILAGFLMSFGVWNHVIFLPTALSLVTCYAIFMWPGVRRAFTNGAFFLLGFVVGLIPRFLSVFLFGNVLFPQRPPIPRASLYSSGLNFLYTLSGDGLYARFSGGSVIPFFWEIVGILIVLLITFYFLKHNKTEKNIFWGICLFLIFNFFGVWFITPFGSMGSRLWLIPSWLFPVLFVVWMADIMAWRWRILGGIMIFVNLLLLLVNHYIPNSRSGGVISPSVYVGGKSDNTWDYYDHRQIVKKLAQTDTEYIFISNINVFSFYYLMPPDQRHRIKILWPIIQYSTNREKQRLYDPIIYKGPFPQSALFVFYDNDKDYLDTFYHENYFRKTILDSNAGIPGFMVFRLK